MEQHNEPISSYIGENSDITCETICGFSVRSSKLELLKKIHELMNENRTLKVKLKDLECHVTELQATIEHLESSVPMDKNEKPRHSPNNSSKAMKEEMQIPTVNEYSFECVVSQISGENEDKELDENHLLVTNLIKEEYRELRNVESENGAEEEVYQQDPDGYDEIKDTVHNADPELFNMLGGVPIKEEIADVLEDTQDTEFSHSYYNKQRCAMVVKSGTSMQKKQKVHMCELCNKTFQCSGTYKIHMNNHLREQKIEPPYQCQLCKKTFSWKSSLRKHHKICKCNDAKVVNKKPEIFSQCSEKFLDTDTTCSSPTTTLNQFKCSICDALLKTKAGLREHAKIHSGESIKCSFCNKQYKSKSAYRRHRTTHHERRCVKKPCGICGKEVYNLESHMRNHDPDDIRPLQCSNCGKRFRSKSALDLHMMDHTGERPFRCQVCEKGLKTRACMTEHMIVHTGERNHICEVCGKAFFSASSLKLHMSTHSDEKPFTCEECQESFKLRKTLKCHMQRHSDSRPSVCDICDKRFKCQKQLLDHMPVHTGERRFQCLYCEDRFKQAGHRNTHMKLVHKHEMKPKTA